MKTAKSTTVTVLDDDGSKFYLLKTRCKDRTGAHATRASVRKIFAHAGHSVAVAVFALYGLKYEVDALFNADRLFLDIGCHAFSGRSARAIKKWALAK